MFTQLVSFILVCAGAFASILSISLMIFCLMVNGDFPFALFGGSAISTIICAMIVKEFSKSLRD